MKDRSLSQQGKVFGDMYPVCMVVIGILRSTKYVESMSNPIQKQNRKKKTIKRKTWKSQRGNGLIYKASSNSSQKLLSPQISYPVGLKQDLTRIIVGCFA